MAFTRGYDDKDRINMFQQQDLESCSYMLNAPGNGTKPSYIEDPQIRLQKFGANLSHNIVDINSDLKGISRQLNKGCIDEQLQKLNGTLNNNYSKINYPNISSAITDQPRSMQPAWELRDLEQNNWNYLHSNPQEHTELRFNNNILSRILEKDNYINGLCS